MDESSDRVIDAYEAAGRLGVELRTLLRWTNRGAGPPTASTVSGSVAFSIRDLEEWQDRLGVPLEPAEETLVGSLPDGYTVFHVLRTGATGHDRFEIRLGHRVLASYRSLRGACGYVVDLLGGAATMISVAPTTRTV